MLKIKALCCDNNLEIDSLISLFKDVYGDNFPAQRVYNRQFWSSHIGKRFVSIGAFSGDQLVGHLALQPERDSAGVVQVSMPAFSPEFFENHRFFSNLFRNLLEDLQKRQNWKCLYTFCFTSNVQIEMLAREILQTQETAILPDYLPGLSTRDLLSIDITNKVDVVTSFRVFEACQDFEKMLFAPKEHMQMCKNIFNSLGLARNFSNSQNSDTSRLFGLPENQRALTCQHYKGINVRHFFCNPSLLGNFSKIKSICLEEIRQSDYFFVNMADPLCPELCEILGQNGFAFSGCLPILKGSDYIIYYRSPSMEIKTVTFTSDFSKRLATHIKLHLGNQPVVSNSWSSF
jgi:hypothetical protein